MPPKKNQKKRQSIKPPKIPVPPLEYSSKSDYFGTIEINLISLESQFETGMFTLIIVYGNNFIGKINKINIPIGGGKVDINRKFYLYIKTVDNYVMDALISTPFFFSMIEGDNKMDPEMFALYGLAAAIQTKVVGQGNLGIMPLLTGQSEMESVVVFEPPGTQETVFFRRKYSEHPRLTLKLVDAKKNLSAKQLNNIMWLSVESVYNLDKCHFLEDAEHTLVFPLPAMSLDEEQAWLEEMFAVGEEPYEEVKQESIKPTAKKPKQKTKAQKQPSILISNQAPPQQKKKGIKKPPDLDLIQFDRGIYKIEQTIDIRKKWASLASINGAPAMTDQRIRTDSSDLLSTVALDLHKKFRAKNEPRIEWNMVRPIWLHSELEKLVKERIIQYGVWPFELLMLGKLFVEPKQLTGKLKTKMTQDKEKLNRIKSDIENIFSEFRDVMELLDKTGKDKFVEQVEIARKLTDLEAKMQELLATYEPNPKQKGNLLAGMPYVEKLREERKSKRVGAEKSKTVGTEKSKTLRREKSKAVGEERPATPQLDTGSEATQGPKEFLNQDDIVVLERRAYIAWVDLSPLLVPGCTHLRTTGVLQYFNREEAVAKWGLTTTFSGDPKEMCVRDKDLASVLTKDPVDINKIYMDLKKSDLIKCSTNLLLLLGRLLDVSYNIKKGEGEPGQPAETVSEMPAGVATENEEKKRTKALKFQDEKKKFKPGQRFKIETDGSMKNKDFRNLSPKTGQLKTDSTGIHDVSIRNLDKQETNWLKMKAFDVNEILKSSAVKKKKTRPKIHKSAVSSPISEDQSIGEEHKMIKTKTMQHYLNRHITHSQDVFSIYKTDAELEGKIVKSPKKGPTAEESPEVSIESIPADETLTSTDSSDMSPPPNDKNLPKTKNKVDKKYSYKQSINKLDEREKDLHTSLQNLSLRMSQTDGEESLFELLKSLLVTITYRYEKLKDRYKVLKGMKAKEGVGTLDSSDQETISILSESDYDEETTEESLSSNDELGIKKVEPRHKMWHIGQNLSDDVMENQIQYTNDIRKMAVMERQFLLLKRLRLAQMKNEWEQKVREIIPEYLENRRGEKVVVVIDIKLLKPLVPKPSLAEIDLNIQEYIKDRHRKDNPVCYVNDTFDDFHNCIITLTNLITTEYQDYKKSYSSTMDPLSGETGNEFYEYLEKSRAHQIITESLSEGMKGYLATALRDPIPTDDQNDQKKLRYYVGWLHSRIVEEMQYVVNKTIIDKDHSLPETNVGDLPNISCHDLYLFAVEAIEEMDYERAKYYLSKRLEGNRRTEPMHWIEYAVIALRIGDYQQAMECVKEALVIDSRFKEGLIMYAVMLMMEGKFEDAQLFFNALISFYPMFIEGWMAFHMFYLIVESKTGADITLVAGTKISRDFELSAPTKPPQLSWDNKTWIDSDPGNYISTAIYFLSFNLYEFAEVCLAQELERVGTKSLVWIYYLSVCHYIQGRYEDSAKHLSKAIAEVHDYNMDPRIWILLGHNSWMMGLKKCAVQMYLQAFTKKRVELHEHMTYIRCGFFFLEKEHARFAKQMFLRAVRRQGTPMGWLGLGIALFMEGKMEDAELALKEANMLDTTLATAWGYLALISLYKLKEDQFLHCFREAKRYGLDDKKLAFEIEMISEQIASYRKKKRSQQSESCL